MHIRDSVVFVTGANRGIGRALIEALLERGARRIYASGRDASSLAPVGRLDAERIRLVRLDVRNPLDASAAAEQAPDVDLLINNAGILTLGPPGGATLDDVLSTLVTNFVGVLQVTNAFTLVLERNAGAVVNMLSIVALASMPQLAVYTASKAAALSLTQAYRAALGKRRVAVHAVFPGPVDTDMSRPFETAKTAAIDVAHATLAGVEAGEEDIFPDPVSRQLYAEWRSDHKAVERRFAAM